MLEAPPSLEGLLIALQKQMSRSLCEVTGKGINQRHGLSQRASSTANVSKTSENCFTELVLALRPALAASGEHLIRMGYIKGVF